MESKSSLVIYRSCKTEIIGKERVYDDTEASEIFYGVRTKKLKLSDRNRHLGGKTRCVLCGAEVEDISHFVLWCLTYAEKRSREPKLQLPYVAEENQIIGDLIFNEEKQERTKMTLYRMWRTRNKKIKEIA